MATCGRSISAQTQHWQWLSGEEFFAAALISRMAATHTAQCSGMASSTSTVAMTRSGTMTCCNWIWRPKSGAGSWCMARIAPPAATFMRRCYGRTVLVEETNIDRAA
ncbi:unnamed protein product [Durusdinium trenchii]|uniref:Uncharacterized protein n=1 Tax=Durusdinium trenchii TaxID=1381693 RepID=A0ABP0L8E3_9DINO